MVCEDQKRNRLRSLKWVARLSHLFQRSNVLIINSLKYWQYEWNALKGSQIISYSLLFKNPFHFSFRFALNILYNFANDPRLIPVRVIICKKIFERNKLQRLFFVCYARIHFLFRQRKHFIIMTKIHISI